MQIKYISFLLSVAAILLLESSCTIHRPVIHKAVKNREQLMQTAGELVLQYQHTKKREVFLEPDDSLDNKYHYLLAGIMKTPAVQIVYDSIGSLIRTDSVVVFTKKGSPFFGNDRMILIDYKQTARSDFHSCTGCNLIKKIGDRMYFLRSPTPFPIF